MTSRSLLSSLGVAALAAAFLMTGCQTVEEQAITKNEQSVKEFSLEGMKLGDRTTALTRFASVRRVASANGYDIYEIYNPNEQISTAVAYFTADKLKKLELRYFNGDRIRTLTKAGGWDGLRDFLITRFGPVSRAGKDVPLQTSQPGLKVEYAKFNGEWIFSRQNRQINYVVLADASGGVGVVTFMDTTPIARPVTVVPTAQAKPAATTATTTTTVVPQQPTGPNPGF